MFYNFGISGIKRKLQKKTTKILKMSTVIIAVFLKILTHSGDADSSYFNEQKKGI